MKATAVLALAACGARAPAPHPPPASPKPLDPPSDAMPWATSGVDWTKPPPLGDGVSFVPPAIETFALANGVRVFLVERHQLPLVSITSVHTAAGSREDGARRGLAALTADLLDEGPAFAEDVERAGAQLEIAITTDYATVSMSLLADHLADGVALLATSLRKPRFADVDVTRVRADRIAELADRADRPHLIAARLFDAIVFGEHPYAHASDGVAATLGKIATTEVRAFWKRAYTPATTTLIVVGDTRRAALEPVLATAFADWTAATPEPPRTPLVAGPSTPQLAYVDRPGATSTAIMIGRRAYAAGDARQIAADIENAVLGAERTSRFERVAASAGAPPGIGSSFWRGRFGGTWTIATMVKAASTIELVRRLREAIETARTTDATQDEIDRAKRSLLARLPTTFETNASTARALVRLVAYNQPLDFFATYRDQLAAVTPATARAALAPLMSDLTIVVVGDWKEIGPGLTALGLPVHRYTTVP